MEGNYETNKKYRNLRDSLIIKNEGYQPKVHFDIYGIPTIASGAALVNREKEPKTGNRRFKVADNNLGVMQDVLGADSKEFQKIQEIAELVKNAINNTPEPLYKDQKSKTLGKFFGSIRGQALKKIFPDIKGSVVWTLASSPSITKEIGSKIMSGVIDFKEKEFVKHLKTNRLTDTQFTEVQRVAVFDAYYQGRTINWVNAFKVIKAGGTNFQLCAALVDSAFKSRSQRICEILTDKQATFINGKIIINGKAFSLADLLKTASCIDGTDSFSQHTQGTCSSHQGVSQWSQKPPTKK